MPSLPKFVPYKLGISVLDRTPHGDAGAVLNLNFKEIADHLEALELQTADLAVVEADVAALQVALDTKLSLSGGTMTSNLDMGGNSIQQANNIAANSLNVLDLFAGGVNVVGGVSANNIGASNFIDAASYRVDGVPGVSATFTTITSITITNGIVTSVTGS